MLTLVGTGLNGNLSTSFWWQWHSDCGDGSVGCGKKTAVRFEQWVGREGGKVWVVQVN